MQKKRTYFYPPNRSQFSLPCFSQNNSSLSASKFRANLTSSNSTKISLSGSSKLRPAILKFNAFVVHFLPDEIRPISFLRTFPSFPNLVGTSSVFTFQKPLT
ncbi:hypothetical protein V6Z12_D13G124700 [Gossypium hirsutum]